MKFGKEIQDFIKKNQQYIAPIRYLDYKLLKKTVKKLKKVKKEEDQKANDEVRIEFIKECEEELGKITRFVVMQHKILSEKSKLIPEQEELTPDVDTTIRDLCAEYRAFIDYIEINNEAYRKIGKKWDKNYGTDTLQRDLVDKMKSSTEDILKECKEEATRLFERGGTITESLNDRGQVARDVREMWNFVRVIDHSCSY